MKLLRSHKNKQLRTPEAWMMIPTLLPILFPAWVTLNERYRVNSRERRREAWRTHSCGPRRHSGRRLADYGQLAGHPDESGCGTHECVRHEPAQAPGGQSLARF